MTHHTESELGLTPMAVYKEGDDSPPDWNQSFLREVETSDTSFFGVEAMGRSKLLLGAFKCLAKGCRALSTVWQRVSGFF